LEVSPPPCKEVIRLDGSHPSLLGKPVVKITAMKSVA